MLDFLDEHVQVIERTVDRCEPYVGNGRDGVELFECLLTDFGAFDEMGVSGLFPDAVLDPVEDLLDGVVAYLQLIGTGQHAAFDLLDVEGLLGSVFLYDDDRFFLNTLIARESVAALGAFTPPPDRCGIPVLS